ncbi:EAL and HDOD domain-containing protein [Virgisporangium aurantiacum]|uniref:Histidine kinase n=1 Tax=Virgisporangium aurantiacum TaxID=175570 RepID=A0A8J3Z174_9ACTN|nr:HDOD domain-containing protein [Virgisporangium aurantiacum]GIJ54602.1 histidine kinase [Virgisporangium aurantiacum]
MASDPILGAALPVHVGRQPIYHRTGDVAAYELLFRADAGAVEASDRSSFATSRVIVAAFSDFGVEALAGNHPCFVNVTREFLVGDLPLPFEPGRVGIEVLADIEVDDAVRDGVAALARRGFQIAVDQSGTRPGQEALLPYATHAKIDMLVDDEATINIALSRCALYPHVQLIAERLESPAAVDTATALGFQLLQGHALGRPRALTATALGPLRLRRIHLLVELNKADVDLDRVVSMAQTDPGLALRVLRLVNSAASGTRRTVSSIAEAVMLLGTRQLQQWVTLMVIADITEGDEAALTSAATHARLCRLVAERRRLNGDTAFTAGLLVAVSDLFGLPVADLAAELPLAGELREALITGTGALADVIGTVHVYRAGYAFDGEITADMLDAIRWSNAIPA